jgi:AcrR family transcriptional regulator
MRLPAGQARRGRPPGRPRSPAADEAILAATLELLAEEGYRALSVERVRERAGVGKATIYRRYASKEELVRAAIRHLHYDLPLPADSGSLLGDFAALARSATEGASVTGAFTLMPRLLADVANDRDMHALFAENLVEPRRRIVREILRRAIARGEVRADVDVDLAVDLLVGPVIYRIIITGGDPERLGDPVEVVRTALEGLRPR